MVKDILLRAVNSMVLIVMFDTTVVLLFFSHLVKKKIRLVRN
jgi:hypothetical protein